MSTAVNKAFYEGVLETYKTTIPNGLCNVDQFNEAWNESEGKGEIQVKALSFITSLGIESKVDITDESLFQIKAVSMRNPLIDRILRVAFLKYAISHE